VELLIKIKADMSEPALRLNSLKTLSFQRSQGILFFTFGSHPASDVFNNNLKIPSVPQKN